MRWAMGIGVVFLFAGAGAASSEPAAVVEKVGAANAKVAAVVGEKSDAGSAGDAETAPVTRSVSRPAQKPKPQVPTLFAKIDLSSQTMRVTAAGKLVGSWPISSGASGYETPPGQFRPKWTSKMHYSRKYDNAPMPYSVFFNGGIATHGTNAVGRLGAPASHGCIRLRTAHAKSFYNLVQRHGYKATRIVVTGRAKQTLTASNTRRQRSERARRNSYSAPLATQWGQNSFSTGRRSQAQRYTLKHYDDVRMRRHQERLQRYYQSRSRAYSGRGYRNSW